MQKENDKMSQNDGEDKLYPLATCKEIMEDLI